MSEAAGEDQRAQEERLVAQEDQPEPRYYCAGKTKGCTHEAHEPWIGRCPGCGRHYDVVERKRPRGDKSVLSLAALVAKTPPMEHLATGIECLDEVTNGGVVIGTTILLGGKRGSGKTTLSLQAAQGFARKHGPALVASGEQPSRQIGEYALRLGLSHDKVHVIGDDAGGTDPEQIVAVAEQVRAKFVVIDSANTCVFDDVKGNAGSPAQVDQVANFFTEWAQLKRRSLLLLSHMSKMGDFAGGTKLQHLVDALLYLDNLEEQDPTTKDVEKATRGMRRLVVDGKSRLGTADLRAYVEMEQDTGLMKAPSRKRVARWENFALVLPDEDEE